MLTRQRIKLGEFEARRNLFVADVLTLSRESAPVEIQLEALTKLRSSNNGASERIC